MIAPISRARKEMEKRGQVKGEYGRILGEEKGNTDYGGMVQPSQQHIAPCVKEVEWGLGTRGLRMLCCDKWPGWKWPIIVVRLEVVQVGILRV